MPPCLKCTQAASGSGRTVSIAADEARQRKYRKLQQTLLEAAHCSADAPPWSTLSLTSPHAKDTGLAMSASVGTCSTCDAPPQSRTSKDCNACLLPA